MSRLSDILGVDENEPALHDVDFLHASLISAYNGLDALSHLLEAKNKELDATKLELLMYKPDDPKLEVPPMVNEHWPTWLSILVLAGAVLLAVVLLFA